MLFARLLFKTDCCCLQYFLTQSLILMILEIICVTHSQMAISLIPPHFHQTPHTHTNACQSQKKQKQDKMSLHLLMLTGDSGIEEGLSAMLRSIPTSLLLRFLCKEHRLQVELRSSLIVYLQVV